MEYLSGGMLFDLCVKMNGMRESAVHFFMCQLIDGMANMHRNEVVHLDIKPENIILDSNYNIKIADFGMATNKNIRKLSLFRGT